MNNTHINTTVYAQKVELLLRLMPIIMEEGVFAVHGGTAINLFYKREGKWAAMANQFDGMTDIPFTYEEFEQTRSELIEDVNTLMANEYKPQLIL